MSQYFAPEPEETTPAEPAVAPVQPPIDPPAEITTPVEEPPEATPEAPVEEQNDAADKPQPTRYQKRLTAAQQELEYWKTEALKQKQELPPPSQVPQGKPIFATFNGDIEAYTEALTDWKVQSQFSQFQEKQQASTRQSSYQQKAAEFAQKTPDFDDVLADAPAVSQVVLEAIQESNAPELAYKLAQDHALIAKLNTMSPARQLVELGKLEATLQAAPKVALKTTAAPKPLSPVQGSTVTAPSLNDPNITQAQWRELRKQQGLGR